METGKPNNGISQMLLAEKYQFWVISVHPVKWISYIIFLLQCPAEIPATFLNCNLRDPGEHRRVVVVDSLCYGLIIFLQYFQRLTKRIILLILKNVSLFESKDTVFNTVAFFKLMYMWLRKIQHIALLIFYQEQYYSFIKWKALGVAITYSLVSKI